MTGRELSERAQRAGRVWDAHPTSIDSAASKHCRRIGITCRGAQDGTGSVTGQGVAWIEIGGPRDDLRDWLGPVFTATEDAVDIRYNGGRSGLHAVGVNTSGGEREIRCQPPR